MYQYRNADHDRQRPIKRGDTELKKDPKNDTNTKNEEDDSNGTSIDSEGGIPDPYAITESKGHDKSITETKQQYKDEKKKFTMTHTEEMIQCKKELSDKFNKKEQEYISKERELLAIKKALDGKIQQLKEQRDEYQLLKENFDAKEKIRSDLTKRNKKLMERQSIVSKSLAKVQKQLERSDSTIMSRQLLQDIQSQTLCSSPSNVPNEEKKEQNKLQIIEKDKISHGDEAEKNLCDKGVSSVSTISCSVTNDGDPDEVLLTQVHSRVGVEETVDGSLTQETVDGSLTQETVDGSLTQVYTPEKQPDSPKFDTSQSTEGNKTKDCSGVLLTMDSDINLNHDYSSNKRKSHSLKNSADEEEATLSIVQKDDEEATLKIDQEDDEEATLKIDYEEYDEENKEDDTEEDLEERDPKRRRT